ncbi:hypothetical protein CDAR_578351 [Caerostris darwini]|uniref:Uncharacterized protein n=1 Tax=Caerostris darwini TaxID=1538125 RepID=A0AAV4QCA9_9ARAC|nr:hypothetical protein CDAR_578221 [Caerostris darwini]GIY06749.1 hypothetical protein CDAR_578351 [Caerostris darwini]
MIRSPMEHLPGRRFQNPIPTVPNNIGIVNLTHKQKKISATCANGRSCPATVTTLVDGGQSTLATATLGNQ